MYDLSIIPYFPSLKSSWFPVHLLPRVVTAPAVAGRLRVAWHGIHRGTPVGVAMGDLQCSVLAAQPKHTDAGTVYLNYSPSILYHKKKHGVYDNLVSTNCDFGLRGMGAYTRDNT